MAKPQQTSVYPPTDAEKLLELMASAGYRMVRKDLTELARHLSNLDGRGTAWTPSYLMAVAKGQLGASSRLLDAMERCAIWKPPKPGWIRNEFRLDPRQCPCGEYFMPNAMTRIRCYKCQPIRSKKS